MQSTYLTIFEGPDGAGKTTAAKAYADSVGARYVHFSAMPHVKRGLARMYVEAMMPAILGLEHVVMDRCWLSELPYGAVYREGESRLTVADVRMLERLALRCDAVVIMCLPALEVVQENFNKRRHLEMLKDSDQLRDVYGVYKGEVHSDLRLRIYDYTQEPWLDIEHSRSRCHMLDMATAGQLDPSSIALVGESFAERKNDDPFYQWPFASFGGNGCSQWLTDQLEKAEIPEDDLYWINADQDLGHLPLFKSVIALGNTASAALTKARIEHKVAEHPQYWRRFRSGVHYPLIDLIRDVWGA